MPNPQLQVENGNFTRIVNPLIEELIKVPFKGCELQVAMFIIRKTYGFLKVQDEISLTQFEKGINRSRPTVVKALANLQLVNIAKLVKVGESKKRSSIWSINKYTDTWKLVNIAKLVKRNGGTSKAVYTKTSKAVLTHKRKKERQKKVSSEQSSQAPFDFEEYLGRMEEHTARHIQVIAFYFRKKKIRFRTLAESQSAIRRHLRSAREVANFDDESIVKAYKIAEREYPQVYTVETLLKILTR